MFLRSASFDDVPIIKKMWTSFFQDPEEYVLLYLQQRFNPDFTAILEESGEVVGMIHLLPCILKPNHKAFYWYAAGIREEYRNRGYFRRFLQMVLKECQRLGYANFCVPAPGLEKVYEKYGFAHPYFVSERHFTRSNKSDRSDQSFPFDIVAAKPEDFLLAFPEKGSTQWDLSAIKYALLENEVSGGRAIKITNGKETYIALAIKKEYGYLIDSTNLTNEAMKHCQNAIFKHLNCDCLLLRSTSSQSSKDDSKIFGLSDCSLINSKSKLTFSLS